MNKDIYDIVKKEQAEKIDSSQFAFVYKKGERIKVLGLEDAKEVGKHFETEGWKHIETINPLVALEYLYNVEKNERIISYFENK